MNVMGTVGKSFNLSGCGIVQGHLKFNNSHIAYVDESEINIYEISYNNRLKWNNATGHFSLTDLKMNDSGEYIIDSKKPHFIQRYYLTVSGK